MGHAAHMNLHIMSSPGGAVWPLEETKLNLVVTGFCVGKGFWSLLVRLLEFRPQHPLRGTSFNQHLANSLSLSLSLSIGAKGTPSPHLPPQREWNPVIAIGWETSNPKSQHLLLGVDRIAEAKSPSILVIPPNPYLLLSVLSTKNKFFCWHFQGSSMPKHHQHRQVVVFWVEISILANEFPNKGKWQYASYTLVVYKTYGLPLKQHMQCSPLVRSMDEWM